MKEALLVPELETLELKSTQPSKKTFMTRPVERFWQPIECEDEFEYEERHEII
jgi:hypothetical protein